MEHLLSLMLVLALGNLGAGHMLKAQIIGGREAARGSRPYMASLQRAGNHICGGVLVHPRWVLTAAHCVANQTVRPTVLLGLHSLHSQSDPGVRFLVKRFVPHPDYKPPPVLENDLALLKLDGKVKTTRTIRPLSLLEKPKVVAAGTWCSLAGWGLTQQGGRLARALQELDVRVMDPRMCNNSRFWDGGLSAHTICLSAEGRDRAPCKGDSGGPLVCGRGQGAVAGILSYSSKICTDIFKPPVVTTVAPYLSWIKKTTHHRGSPHQGPETGGEGEQDPTHWWDLPLGGERRGTV